VVFWGNDRGKFGVPESKYRDGRVCVTRRIASYRGKPEIAATDPSQIEVGSKYRNAPCMVPSYILRRQTGPEDRSVASLKTSNLLLFNPLPTIHHDLSPDLSHEIYSEIDLL
jgi:hypothetical protein